MVIGERFAWGHLRKTGGDATLAMLERFPELIVYADPATTVDKHASFASHADAIAGKLLVLNIRRLPTWILSLNHYRVDWRRRLNDPVSLNSPHQMARMRSADRLLAEMTDGGAYKVDRWLRTENLADEVWRFLVEVADVGDDARRRIAEVGSVNALTYDRDLSHWFTNDHIRLMYENNPLWAAVERAAYGDLIELER